MSDVSIDNTEKFPAVSLEDEMKQSYLDYAMSVIVSRALPDIRDEGGGLYIRQAIP